MSLSLNRVLTEAEALPADKQEMLEGLLRQQRIEKWRQEAALEANKTAKAFRAGKLKGQSAESVITRLHTAK